MGLYWGGIVIFFLTSCVGDDLFHSGLEKSCSDYGSLRTQDQKIENNPKIPLWVISLDTKPVPRSDVFKKILDYFGYNYILLGSTENNPQPKGGVFFQPELWSYRFKRYINILKTLDPKSIVILSDANDVVFTEPPQEIIHRFKKFHKSIVISGSVYCCNINRIPYVQEVAKKKGIDDIFKNPSIVKDIYNTLWDNAWIYGFDNKPNLLWSPSAQTEMQLIKKISASNPALPAKYRYINAGTIIGYAENLINAMEEINIQPYGDDEEQWTLWYGKTGFISGKATVDYEQEIFAVTSEMEGRDSAVEILFDDIAALPTRHDCGYTWDFASQKWINEFNHNPAVFHCAGCGGEGYINCLIPLLNQITPLEPHLGAQLDLVKTCEANAISYDGNIK